MLISLIVAHALNGVIGIDNRLPWRLKADLQHFKQRTQGHCVLMGRKTFESIGKPLPHRTNLVLSRSLATPLPAGAQHVSSLEQAIRIAKTQYQEQELFVIGGSEIYALALPLADKIYLTEVQATPQGDAYFHLPHPAQWQTIAEQHFAQDANNEYAFVIREMQRREVITDQ